MDPLSIFGAVTGGISVASELLKALDTAIAAASKIKEAPEQATATLRDVRLMRLNMLRFQQLLDNQAYARDRGAYIRLDDAQNTFTDCVTSLDELESRLKPPADPSLQPLDLVERLEWVMKDKRIETLSKRVHDAQSSLGLMLTILSHESMLEVQKAVAGLPKLTQQIFNNVAHLNRRSTSVRGSIFGTGRLADIAEGDDDASTIRPTSATFRRASRAVSVLRPDSVVIPEVLDEEEEYDIDRSSADMTSTVDYSYQNGFEEALQNSRPYRRAPHWDLDDVSFRSSVFNPRALSLLSKLSQFSLGEVSTLSIVALPLFPTDLFNSQHYHFGDAGLVRNSEYLTGPIGQQLDFDAAALSPSSPSFGLLRTLGTSFNRVIEPLKRRLDADVAKTDDNAYKAIITEPSFPLPTPPSSPPSSGSNTPALKQDETVPVARFSILELGTVFPMSDLINLRVKIGRCHSCDEALVGSAEKEPGWIRIDRWCGFIPSLPSQECSHVHVADKATTSFRGWHLMRSRKLRCEPCSSLCADCAPTQCSAAAQVYHCQKLLFKAQKWLFDNRDTYHSLYKERRRNMNLCMLPLTIQTNGLTESNHLDPSKSLALKKRQDVLISRASMFATWNEMAKQRWLATKLVHPDHSSSYFDEIDSAIKADELFNQLIPEVWIERMKGLGT